MKKTTPTLQRCIIIFADVSGFAKWSRRVDHYEYRYFADRLDKLFNEYEEKHKSFFKKLGDGFMAIFELRKNCESREKIKKVVCNLWDHVEEVNNLIIRLPHYPRPHGYRARISIGQVWHSKGKHEDYTGYSINMTSHLLNIMKDERFIIHQSIKEIVVDSKFQRDKYYIDKLKLKPNHEDSIDEEDLNNLWTINPK